MVVIAGTLVATWMGSGIVTRGPTSRVYMFGLGPAVLGAIMSPLGVVALILLSDRIWELGVDNYTIPEMIQKKCRQGR